MKFFSGSPKLAGYATLAAFALFGALVFGRAELVALAAPFLVAIVAGLLLAPPSQISATATLADDRVLEGGETTVAVTVHAPAAIGRLDLFLAVPQDVTVHEGNPAAVRLRPGELRTVELTLTARRFGAQRLGPLYVRASDSLGFVRWESTVATDLVLRSYPREETLSRLVKPRETQVFAGNEVSRHKGEGIEFADLRSWVPGDAVKRVNWRASARHGELVVNENHPERNTDVILFVDSFAEARSSDEGTLDLAIRATATIARAFGERRDRVGLIGFGGILRWLKPGSGAVQLYRIVDALLDTQIVLSYYWRDLEVIPRGTLPPGALVIALTPLLDERSVGALLDLRARGYDLAVIDVSPVPFTTRPVDPSDSVAYDLWLLRREALRYRLQQTGVAVAEWNIDEPLQAPLEEVSSFRRYARA
ncbi:MAG TPA: DUF58 domain-containing protein [Gaiellaceae bacterium]